MINRFALSFLCIELDRNVRFGVTLLYILLPLPQVVTTRYTVDTLYIGFLLSIAIGYKR